MSFRYFVLAIVPAASLLFTPISVSADQAGANACAAKLPKDARAIYDASAPGAAGSSDLKQVVTQQTRSLAMSGRIDRGGARASAEAAGACLKLAAS